MIPKAHRYCHSQEKDCMNLSVFIRYVHGSNVLIMLQVGNDKSRKCQPYSIMPSLQACPTGYFLVLKARCAAKFLVQRRICTFSSTKRFICGRDTPSAAVSDRNS
jgi:hypothetical protein